MLFSTMFLLGFIPAVQVFAEATGSTDVTTGLPFHFDINNLTATAVLAWYAWYTASRSIPDIIKQHIDASKAAQEQFISEMASTRKTFQDQIATLQSTTHADAMAVAKGIGDLSQAIGVLQERLTNHAG